MMAVVTLAVAGHETPMKKAKTKQPNRRVLVILRNRFSPGTPARYLELEASEEGDILAEKKLRSEPKEARFDEVWENDEGKLTLDDCNRIKRIYRHALEKR